MGRCLSCVARSSPDPSIDRSHTRPPTRIHTNQDAALWKETLPAATASFMGEEGGNTSSCWAPPRFKRAVLVVIDALRFDFVAPVEEDEEEEEEDGDGVMVGVGAKRPRRRRRSGGKGPEMYHINKLPVVRPRFLLLALSSYPLSHHHPDNPQPSQTLFLSQSTPTHR